MFHLTRRDHPRLRRIVAGAACVILLSLVLAACGDSDGREDVPGDGESVAPTAKVAADQDAVSGISTATVSASRPTSTSTTEHSPQLGPDGHYTEVQVSSDGTRHLIPLDEVHSGGPPKDGIPSIDIPRFVGRDGWDELDYRDSDLVIGVEVDGTRRAYPFQILVWHELVNDTVEGTPLLISYCPLCGTGIVFERLIDGEPVEFGVSGKLYNSDLLMYDRKTDTLWSQITGTAVVGELTGMRLALYPSEIMTWEDWRQTYPDSEVLSRDTGHDRDYDTDPYGTYYTDGSIWFPVSGTDARLPAKERVTGIEIDSETFGAYPDEAVIEHGPVNDLLGDVPVLIAADPTAGNNIVAFDRRVNGREFTFEDVGDTLIDRETGTRWNYQGEAIDGELAGARMDELFAVKGFWFAWYAFHPQTDLWQPS